MGCGYHGDDGYSFYSGNGGPYNLSCYGYTAGYTTAMTNENISLKPNNNVLALEYQEKFYFIMGGYENMLANLPTN
ncbi:hypothetical protein C2G38_2239749 [Gigaspora rosea]|uniref:Uncharacterized protein n=1 Tax=Gigaspora rosea TaxID=44941 RepID=A0A397W1X6_9GLOM|nr:hypothetical protein C2G38_2239749 [Gigaspora rosea]